MSQGNDLEDGTIAETAQALPALLQQVGQL